MGLCALLDLGGLHRVNEFLRGISKFLVIMEFDLCFIFGFMSNMKIGLEDMG